MACSPHPQNVRAYFKSILAWVLITLSLNGCNDQIVHDLTEADGNRLLAKLEQGSISAEKVKQPDGKWAIAVDSSQAITAIKFLNENRLLNERNTAPLEKSSIISSREDQRFKYERALSREIESTIQNIPGVLDARVHLNLPPVDPLFGQPLNNSQGSASVLAVTSSGDLDKSEIVSLVSGASGVPPPSISVLVKVASAPSVTTPIAADNGASEGFVETEQKPVITAPLVQTDTALKVWFSNWRYELIALAIFLLSVGAGTLALIVRGKDFQRGRLL